MAPAGNVAEATRLPGELGPFWRAGTDSMLFVARENRRGAVWTMSRDGSRRRRLTPDRLNLAAVLPAALADVVFVGVWSEDDTPENWRMDREGGGLQQAANGAGRFFRDGLTIFFNKPGDDSLWKMAAGGGAEEKVSETRRATPRFSPDGRRFWRFPADVPARDAPMTITVVTIDGERLASSLALPADSRDIQWTPAGDALTFVRTVDGVDNIWRIPVAGGESRRVTGFTSGRLWEYAFTADGSRLFFTRREETSNEVLLIRNFR